MILKIKRPHVCKRFGDCSSNELHQYCNGRATCSNCQFNKEEMVEKTSTACLVILRDFYDGTLSLPYGRKAKDIEEAHESHKDMEVNLMDM